MTTRIYRNPRLKTAALDLVSPPGRCARFARKVFRGMARLCAILGL